MYFAGNQCITPLGLYLQAYLDEINTASCLGLFKEIIIDRTVDGQVKSSPDKNSCCDYFFLPSSSSQFLRMSSSLLPVTLTEGTALHHIVLPVSPG